MIAAPLIQIKGFPGTGKHPVARQLVDIPRNERAVFMDNHQIIDLIKAMMALNHLRDQNLWLHPEYNNRRHTKRATILETSAKDVSMLSKAIVFTDEHHLQAPNRLR